MVELNSGTIMKYLLGETLWTRFSGQFSTTQSCIQQAASSLHTPTDKLQALRRVLLRTTPCQCVIEGNRIQASITHHLLPDPDVHVLTIAARTTPPSRDSGSTASSLNRGMLCQAPTAPGVGGSPLSMANHELHRNSVGWDTKTSHVSSLLTAPPEKMISTSRVTWREVRFLQPEDRERRSPSTISVVTSCFMCVCLYIPACTVVCFRFVYCMLVDVCTYVRACVCVCVPHLEICDEDCRK